MDISHDLFIACVSFGLAVQGLMGMDGSPQARTTAAGLVQMLVYEDKRVSNSALAGPNYDGLRHRIVFDGAVMSTIAGLLEVQGAHSHSAATQIHNPIYATSALVFTGF